MRADVSVDCLSNSAGLIAAGVGHLDVKPCPSSCLSANPSCPPCDYCYCCLPPVPAGRQSTLSLFVIVCKKAVPPFRLCTHPHCWIGSSSISVQKVFFCYHKVWTFTVNCGDRELKVFWSFCLSLPHSKTFQQFVETKNKQDPIAN